MSPEYVTFINTVVVPWGLIAVMFSLGLSLSLSDFRKTIAEPKAVLVGLFGQLVILPPLAYLVVVLFRLPPEMAIGLIVLAVCPGGVTSNAVSFAVKANVALSVTLTAIASLVTVFTTPLLVSLALQAFSTSGDVPAFSVGDTILRLAKITAIPVALGMVIRHFQAALSDTLIVWLRPASMIVLIAVIGFSLFVSAEMVANNIVAAGPAAFVLNVLAISAGLLLGRWALLNSTDRMTIAIEVGIQNATVATFLTLSVLGNLELAITPTLYGAIMIFNAFVLVRILRYRQASVAT